jgi:hypothetical protein
VLLILIDVRGSKPLDKRCREYLHCLPTVVADPGEFAL